MTLDSWLVARLGKELDERLRGARIETIHTSGRDVIFFCYRRGAHVALHARLDSSAPAVAAYQTTRPHNEPERQGWLGEAGALLRDAKIERISCIPNDRVLVVEVSSRSAFGLPSLSRIVLELQPRKANALVLRPARDDTTWVVIAAHKHIGAGATRRITTGVQYVPPPVQHSRVDRAQFIIAARDAGPPDARAWERLLSNYDPACTPMLAREVMYRVGAAHPAQPAHAALHEWVRVRGEVEDAFARMEAVFVWRDGVEIAACHLIELHWPHGSPARAGSLNDLCAQELIRPARAPEDRRDNAAVNRLTTMLARGVQETRRLEAALADAERANALRTDGDAIYANLAAIPPGSSEFVVASGRKIALDPNLTAKENAAEFFRKYKKARSGAPAMRARLQTLAANREYWEHVLWELTRADHTPAERATLLADLGPLLGLKRRTKTKPRLQGERSHDLGGGVVAYVGRSPKDNERLTFSLAGPDDLWFHARGVPGAHVIVKTPRKTSLTDEQLRRAAALAATHSKASGATSVEVDYTRRKHVRRRGGGRAGLVWYTHASTLRVDV
jgi:predicted ribosome quality control (RQC) complex YloA/Tae2 family protein